jgi:4-amino-4-deoxy-L-arabinose transferase-like glycosyltransferase
MSRQTVGVAIRAVNTRSHRTHCPSLTTMMAPSALKETATAGAGDDPARTARPWWVFALLAALVLFLLVNNGIWLLNDTTPPSFDRSAHTIAALKYLRLIEAPTRLSLTKLLTVTQYWPPLFHFCSVPFTLLLGFSVQAVAASNFLFLVIAVCSIYGIGRHLFDDAVGVGAAAATMFYPIVFALSRDVLVDFTLTSMVVLGVYLVIVSRGGLDPRRSVALGAALGCAMLAKWTAVVFVAGPALLWFALHVTDRRQTTRSKIASVAVVAAVCAVVALPWYVTAIHQFAAGARVALGYDPAREGDPVRFWESVVYYWKTFPEVLIMRPMLPMTALGLGLAVCAFGRASWRPLTLLLCWIVLPLLVFVLLPNKDGRFIVPLLPAVALLTAAGLQRMPWRALRLLAWACLLAIGLYQYYTVSFGWPAVQANYYAHVPSKRDWKYAKILTALNLSFPGRPLRIAVLANEPCFEPNLFRVVCELRNLPYHVEGFGDSPADVQQLAGFDVFISKTGSLALAHTARWRLPFRDAVREWVAAGHGSPRLSLWRTWPLPDGSQGEVYLVQ